MILALENILFSHRRGFLAAFAALTLVLGCFATQLRNDASFNKLLSPGSAYTETYQHAAAQFGSGNILLIALEAKQGDIFSVDYLDKFENLSQDVLALPGIDRSHVSSLLTPDTGFATVTGGHLIINPVVPGDFKPDSGNLALLKTNIGKAGIAGRLVSADFHAAIVSATLNDTPGMGKDLDYSEISKKLDQVIRAKYDTHSTRVRIQGFAQVAGDMAHGGQAALVFFAIALAVVGLVLYFVSRSLYLTAVALGLPVVAVIWQLGILRVFGYGIDPIAVPALFLVLAIGVSHGAHMALATARLIGDGKTGAAAARLSFTRLIDPGFAALVVAALGMVTLTIAAVPVIRELALSSAIGLAVLCLTHLLILPLLASFAAIPASNLFAAQRSAAFFETIWRALASLASPLQAMLIVFATFIAVIVAIAMLGGPAIGDLHTGAAALRAQSRYNQDAAYFQQNFPAGGDVLQVIASGKSNVCLDHDAVARIDDLNYRLQSVPGVSRTLFMAHLFRAANVSWNEGNPKFDYLPYDSRILGRNNAVFAAQRELTNADCSVMPLTIFLTDHRGDTIQTVMRAVEAFAKTPGSDKVNFSLAAGNAGVTGAANDAAFAAEIPVMALIYALVMAAGFAVFRSLRAVICIVPPLAAVSVLLYVAMAVLGIGLTPETLPVLAWSVVIGADYSFYLFARLNHYLRQGYTLYDAYLQTLRETGNVAIFIALALTAGVGTWMFAPLRYQVEIGMLLAVMFIMNMLAAILVQPAIMAVANLIAPPKYAKDLPEIVR